MWSYALRAGALNRGLAPRESLMVAADSVLAAVSDAPALDVEAQRQRKRVIAILELANRRFPDDAEVWYQLGRARNRIGYLIGVQPEQALEALDRAIALDSAFAPAYVEAISFATMARGQEATRRYLNGVPGPGPEGDAGGRGPARSRPDGSETLPVRRRGPHAGYGLGPDALSHHEHLRVRRRLRRDLHSARTPPGEARPRSQPGGRPGSPPAGRSASASRSGGTWPKR